MVPNPYVGAASFEPARFAISGRGERRIEFRGMPQNAHDAHLHRARRPGADAAARTARTDGFVAWDLRTKDNLDVAPGLYIFHVEAPGVGTDVGKFAVIK